MAIKKSPDLRNRLYSLNIKVFTWEWPVGDWIEDAIDWALDWINWGIDQAGVAYNRAIAAWDRANQVRSELFTAINREVGAVLDRISTWWGDLNTWWSARAQDVREWIMVARELVMDQVDSVRRLLDNLSVAWDSFRKDTLPRLLSLDRWTAFWGGAYQSVTDWWAARRREVTDQIDAEVTPVRNEVNKHTTWLDLVQDLFTDPLGYILGRLEKITRSHQALLLKLWDKVMDALWG